MKLLNISSSNPKKLFKLKNEIENNIRKNAIIKKTFIPTNKIVENKIPKIAFLELVKIKKYVIRDKFNIKNIFFFLSDKLNTAKGHILANQNPA